MLSPDLQGRRSRWHVWRPHAAAYARGTICCHHVWGLRNLLESARFIARWYQWSEDYAVISFDVKNPYL